MTFAIHSSDGPKRIQRKRVKGWRMPEGAVYVGRPTKWGNPYRVGWDTSKGLLRYVGEKEALLRFRTALISGDLPVGLDDVTEKLRGRDLACWCYPWLPCHADVLLEIANS